MELHKKEAAALPSVKQGATPAEVAVFEKALADRIKAARDSGKAGRCL